jgi:hypothetical protein
MPVEAAENHILGAGRARSQQVIELATDGGCSSQFIRSVIRSLKDSYPVFDSILPIVDPSNALPYFLRPRAFPANVIQQPVNLSIKITAIVKIPLQSFLSLRLW